MVAANAMKLVEHDGSPDRQGPLIVIFATPMMNWADALSAADTAARAKGSRQVRCEFVQDHRSPFSQSLKNVRIVARRW